jgi:predicted oxidoreductase
MTRAAGFGGGGLHGYRSLEGTFPGSCLFSGRNAGGGEVAIKDSEFNLRPAYRS